MCSQLVQYCTRSDKRRRKVNTDNIELLSTKIYLQSKGKR